MSPVKHCSANRDIVCAEVDGEIEDASKTATGLNDSGSIIVGIGTKIRCRDKGWLGSGVEDVDFVVWAIGWFLVHGECFNDVCTINVICASRADCVVSAVESDSVVWRAGPCEVAEGANDGHDLGVVIWGDVDDGIGAREEAWGTPAIGGVGGTLSYSSGGQHSCCNNG